MRGRTARAHEVTARALAGALLGVFLAAGWTSPALGLAPAGIEGSVDVYRVQSRTDTTRSRTWQQEYALQWRRRLVPAVTARASLRYRQLGIQPGSGEDFWQSDLQPVGELVWKTSSFSLGASGLRRDARSREHTTDLIRDSYTASFNGALPGLPSLTARYDFDRTYNRLDRSQRDTGDRRIQGSLSYGRRAQSLSYRFSRLRSEDRRTNLVTTQAEHRARWSFAERFRQEKLRLTTAYDVSSRSVRRSAGAPGPVVQVLPGALGLYALDPTPDIATLDSLPGLSDGNVGSPTLPAVDIGGSSLDRNLGLDLGAERELDGLDVYTDRISGRQVSWSVYRSSDNVTWEAVAPPPTSDFNTSYNRYEIRFGRLSARYVKAVNGGVNEVTTVYVTEVQAIQQSGAPPQDRTRQLTHLGDVSLTYQPAQRIQLSGDASLRVQSAGDLDIGRDEFYTSLGAKVAPWRVLTNIVRYQYGRQEMTADAADTRTHTLSYTLLLAPLPTLESTLSLLRRREEQPGGGGRQDRNVLWQVNARPLATVHLAGGAGFNRHVPADRPGPLDTRTLRWSAESQVLPSLHLALSWLRQSTEDPSLTEARVKHQWGAEAELRPAGALMVRGSVDQVEEQGSRYREQQYTAAWNLSPRLSAGGLMERTGRPDGVKERRVGANGSYALTSRATLFTNYSSNDFGQQTVPNTASWQLGVRTSF